MLHYWDASWDLRLAECPCDAHFCEWIETRGVRDAAIFHFGTGAHHLVGIRMAENGSGNSVLGITAAPKEYDAFVKLAIERPEVERRYKVFFGDIYQLDGRLLPTFDVVTLFHLCEFRDARNDAYGAMTDRQVLDLLTERTRPGGHILFYTKSFAFDSAEKIIAQWRREAPVVEDGRHQTLIAFRKTG